MGFGRQIFGYEANLFVSVPPRSKSVIVGRAPGIVDEGKLGVGRPILALRPTCSFSFRHEGNLFFFRAPGTEHSAPGTCGADDACAGADVDDYAGDDDDDGLLYLS